MIFFFSHSTNAAGEKRNKTKQRRFRTAAASSELTARAFASLSCKKTPLFCSVFPTWVPNLGKVITFSIKWLQKICVFLTCLRRSFVTWRSWNSAVFPSSAFWLAYAERTRTGQHRTGQDSEERAIERDSFAQENDTRQTRAQKDDTRQEHLCETERGQKGRMARGR